MKKNGARFILEYMKKMEVKYLFGIPGSSNAPFYDELYDFPDIHPLLVNHEQAAAFMADGYYRISHQIAACIGTGGPGAINLISGLDVPFQNYIPVLALTSNHFPKEELLKEGGLMWRFSSATQTNFAKPVTKWATLVSHTDQIPNTIKKAFRIMRKWPQGPVLIDLCYNVMKDPIEKDVAKSESFKEKVIEPSTEELKKVARMIVASDHVTILAGEGVHLSNSNMELLELASLLSAPVATTGFGKSSFPEDHPLALGVLDVDGHPSAQRYLRKDRTDILLALGCNPGCFYTHFSSFLDSIINADRIINVDIFSSKMSGEYKEQINFIGNLDLVLKKLLALVKSKLSKMSEEELREKKHRGEERIREILTLKKELNYYSEPEMYSEAVRIKPQRACKDICDFAEKNAIFWTDCGNNRGWALRYIQTRTPKTFFVDDGLTHMGFSLVASIGTKLAAPERQVFAVIGNASFQMMCKEVFTAAAYNIPVIWCILNDENLGRIKHGQKFGYGRWRPERFIATSNYTIDVENFAKACKIFGRTIEKPSEIKDSLKDACDSGKPSIIDIKIDPDEIHTGYAQQYKTVIENNPSLLSRKIPVPLWPYEILEDVKSA